MENYEITVLYARHGEASEEQLQFPEQSFTSVQVLNVQETDLYHPRKTSLQMLDQINSKYVMMLDEGDVFSPELLKELYMNFKDEQTIFAVPAMMNEFQSDSKGCIRLSQSDNRKINIAFMPKMIPLQLHGILFRTNELKEARDSFEGILEQEKRILLYLYEKNSVFSYIGTETLIYAVPKECDYLYYLSCLDSNWYYRSLEEFLLPVLEQELQKNGNIRIYLQVIALFMVRMRVNANINNRNKHVIENQEAKAYFDLLSEVLKYVDAKTILNPCSDMCKADARNKLFFMRLKKRESHYYPGAMGDEKNLVMNCEGFDIATSKQLQVYIYLIDYLNGCLEIDGNLNDYIQEGEYSLYAKYANKRYPVTYNQRYSLQKCFGVSYCRQKTFHVSVPIKPMAGEEELEFYMEIAGMEYKLPLDFISHTSRFTKSLNYCYWRFGEYFSYHKNNSIRIRKSNKLLVLYKELRLWLQILTSNKGKFRPYLPLKMLNFLLRPYYSRQTILLFFDKIYKGGDSSEYLYRYAVQQKDSVKKYYLLDKESADYKRMRKEGYKPLVRGSMKHRLTFLNADMIIASNSTVFAFNDYTAETSKVIRGDVHFGVACVQHGMSVQKIALAQQRLRDNTKLYFCASKYEIDNLSHPVYDYEGYDALKLTGVPRYDGLKDRAEKILLFSPTWRMQSAMPVTKNEGVARDYNPNFKETDYYRIYNGLINDPRLLAAAKEYGYRIQYVLHPIVSPQIDDFEKNEFVEIISAIGDMSYEKLFCEAALMVTDFSGVQFDFAYMRKPVVYLHHNDIPQHYEEGSFYYDTMGFGEICHTNEELIDTLCDYMKNDCVMPEMYRKRADDFFYYSDNNNCERIYPILMDYIKTHE